MANSAAIVVGRLRLHRQPVDSGDGKDNHPLFPDRLIAVGLT